nr:hypothetical protein [Tanacetum cinerariifolium]
MSTQLATQPNAPQTALSLQQTRANSLLPYLTTSESERAVAIVRKFSTLTFATARTSPQVSGLVKADPQPAPQFTNSPEALAIRQHLETLSDEKLQQGLDYYAALAEPNPTQ